MAVINHMMCWVQGCPCHVHKDADQEPDGDIPKVWVSNTCPLRGYRAPELACGELERFMEELRDDFGLHLLELLAPLRDENAQGRIRRDYLEGMRHLAFMMKLKFSSWEELPYALCGVAHYEESKARSAAQACLAKFEDVIAKRSGDSSGMHALTIAWLSQGTLRDALVLFAQGVSRNDPRLAWLKYNFTRLMFVPILERSVEGRHAVVKKATLHARSLNGSYVSCRLRVKELLDHGHRTPVALQEIAALLGQVRVAKWLGWGVRGEWVGCDCWV